VCTKADAFTSVAWEEPPRGTWGGPLAAAQRLRWDARPHRQFTAGPPSLDTPLAAPQPEKGPCGALPRTWPRRDQDAARVHGGNLLHRLGVVGEHHVLAAKVAQVLQQQAEGRRRAGTGGT
jgi:hypothetical protein